MVTNTAKSFSYLLIGSGRVARHLSHYLNELDIPFQTWDRSQDPHALRRKISDSKIILLAISDGSLEGFYRQNLAGHDMLVVHFSGALDFDGMKAAHPLMTFGPELYELDFYKKIHFVLTGSDSITEVLPGLPNSFSVLEPSQKALYHAHCVLGGNFTSLLISKMQTVFNNMNIPPSAASLYLGQVMANTLKDPVRALTGPLARKDEKTIENNLTALKDDPYLKVYQAFLQAHWPEYPRK